MKRVLTVAFVAALAAGCAAKKAPDTTGAGGFGPDSSTPRPSASTSSESIALRSIYFDFDSSELTSDARSGLQANAGSMKSSSSMAVTVEGHCDERGSNEYNLALGKRRADAAYKYLVDLGIPTSRLTTVSFGEEQPAVDGHNEVAWAKNRRAEFKGR